MDLCFTAAELEEVVSQPCSNYGDAGFDVGQGRVVGEHVYLGVVSKLEEWPERETNRCWFVR